MVLIMRKKTSRTHILSGAWQPIPMDHLFLSVYTDVTKEAGVVSHGHTLRTYSNICCRVSGMDTTVLAPTPSPWLSIDTLRGNSLFLGQNYPMMVKGNPTAVDTMLLPFMRSNCIYTSDVAMVPYRGYHNMRPDIGCFSLDD